MDEVTRAAAGQADRVTPSAWSAPFRIPFGKLNSWFGRGQVVASAGMYWSMLNGAFGKWLV